MEVFGLSRICHENYPFEEVNNTKDFEASKLGGTIEWQQVKKFFEKFKTFI